jgi:hypothetical protein
MLSIPWSEPTRIALEGQPVCPPARTQRLRGTQRSPRLSEKITGSDFQWLWRWSRALPTGRARLSEQRDHRHALRTQATRVQPAVVACDIAHVHRVRTVTVCRERLDPRSAHRAVPAYALLRDRCRAPPPHWENIRKEHTSARQQATRRLRDKFRASVQGPGPFFPDGGSGASGRSIRVTAG